MIDFMVVGAQKAGTTTLYEILKRHPGIYLPVSKEDHFFNREENYKNGLIWYKKNFFPNVAPGQKVGVITPDYMFIKKVPERIIQDIGKNIKFVFLLREPVSRAYSQYMMNKKRGVEARDFVDALEEEFHYDGCDGEHIEEFSYVQKGLYLEQIKRYECFFGRDNLKIFIYEDFYSDKKKQYIDELLAYLDVDIIELESEIQANVSSVYKFPAIMEFIKKDSLPKKVFRGVISSKAVRAAILFKIDNANSSPMKSEIDQKLHKALQAKYFSNEILELEKYLGAPIGAWAV